MNIYIPITPTHLYIKQHAITKLKYFGKTTRLDPLIYLGSGTHWKRHVNKHGKEFVKTLWLSDLYYDTSISEHALHFSSENNIVESDDWANLKSENGLDGGAHLPPQPIVERTCHCGNNFQTKQSSKKATCGYSCSSKLRNRIPIAISKTIFIFKHTVTNEIVEMNTFDFNKHSKLSQQDTNHLTKGIHKIIKLWTIFDVNENCFRNEIPNKKSPTPPTKVCPYCNKIISTANYNRWHGDNCKIINPQQHLSSTNKLRFNDPN
jgi:hypothetical protein